ncbi:nuclease-related domain-containing protein [Sporosarcina pasteurii]|uniref:NERD domain-containing protein n=1 Tax=Sporosarcina pasteurii TaxID=1474 RepID=A0A380C6D5_SPOPA|nr:nuclease-related domain-containing protein [Sporosarcina pasteurii]MDS9471786.1 nuclease-related domain-containing protein [Sporosarcina pasteurii]QBQ04620.1 NERD domain-containing protein [Sporosarcina pasteurii]SUJ13742.1 Uncharacterised protein [Sporosarcina pasteurii]
MAQLVKLLDYVSRYENDLTRYPTQFLRLKQYQWNRMKIQWETGAEHTSSGSEKEREMDEGEENRQNLFASLFRLFKGSKEESEKDSHEIIEEDESLHFNPNVIYNPGSIEQLRQHYLDQLFNFQIKWASSTLMEQSRVAPKYMRDSLLRSFLQSLPDSYLLFYEPIIKLQKAPVELDIILITPVECMCITVLEEEDLAAFSGSGSRFWTKRHGAEEVKVLNPLLSLNRMTKIIAQLFKEQEIDFPIKRYLISRNGYIDYPMGGFDLEVIDRRYYGEWFDSIGKLSTPLKYAQFRAAQAILDVGQTTAINRLLIEDDDIAE